METKRISDNIVFVKSKSSKTAIVKVALFAGTRFEDVNKQGVSHLTEHLASLAIEKNTSSIDKIFSYISDIDGLNTKEIDNCHIKTANEYLIPALKALVLTLSNDLNMQEAFENEKKAIVGASKYDEDCNDPYSLIFEKAHIMQFGQNHPLSHPDDGKSDTAQTLTYQDCVSYFDKQYRKLKKMLVVYGDIDERELENFDFGDVFNNKANPALSALPAFSKKEVVFDYDNSTAEVVLSSVVQKGDLPGNTFLDFVDYVVGQSTFSLLYEHLRGNGLAYDTRSKVYRYSDCSLFALYFGVNDKSASDSVIDSVHQMLSRFDELMAKDRFELCKQAYIKRLGMALDNPMFAVNKTLEYMHFDGEPKDFDEIQQEANGISYSDFIGFIKNHLQKEVLSTTAIK